MRAFMHIFLLHILLANLGLAKGPIVLISIDGLRPDAINDMTAPNIKALIKKGTYYEEARTVRPSITLPSHTSMLTGLLPKEHGILWNHYDENYGPVRFKTVLEIAREHGHHTAAFITKEKLLHLNRPKGTDHFELTDKSASSAVRAYRRYVNNNEVPDVSFIHLPDPDSFGHKTGWMSWAYMYAVREADEAVGSIVRITKEKSDEAPIFIVTADHGGFLFSHLLDIDKNNEIPFLLNGEGIPQGLVLDDEVCGCDAAPSILALLDIDIPENFTGKPVSVTTKSLHTSRAKSTLITP